MADSVLLWLLAMTIALLFLVVGCVVAFSSRGSASTRRKKSEPEQPPTQISAAAMAQMAADQAELFSTLEKLTTTVKRLSSRQGMRDIREREAESSASPPPIGTSKADLLRHYGMHGKVGPEFARAQQELELKQRTN